MSVAAAPGTVVVDCVDPHGLAVFYRKLTGWEITHHERDRVHLGGDGPAQLALRRSAGSGRPPRPCAGEPVLLDLLLSELRSGTSELFAMGATIPEFQPGGDAWVVLADPEGNPFCLTIDATGPV